MCPTIFVPSFNRISSAAAGRLMANNVEKTSKNRVRRMTPPGLACGLADSPSCYAGRSLLNRPSRNGCPKQKPVRSYSRSLIFVSIPDASGRQLVNKRETHKSNGQVLVNAVLVQVESDAKVAGYLSDFAGGLN